MSALEEQVGGTHYKNLPLQPVELAYYLGATPCFTKLAKYIIRDKGDVSENLDKAVHIILLEMELDCFANTNYKEICDTSIYNYWICKFIEDGNLRECLMAMYEKDYGFALSSLDNYRKEYGI